MMDKAEVFAKYLFRHAVKAAEIASVCHRNPEVSQWTVQGIKDWMSIVHQSGMMPCRNVFLSMIQYWFVHLVKSCLFKKPRLGNAVFQQVYDGFDWVGLVFT